MTNGIQDENPVQKPRPPTLWRAFRYQFHWKCLFCSFLVHMCITYAVWCQINHYAYAKQTSFTLKRGPCAHGYNFIPIALGIMMYVVYIMECWNNRVEFSKIRKMNHIEASEYIEKMRRTPPIVWWKSISYHYIRRTRYVTRYRNGDAITATQAFYERINTHTAGSVFMYDICGMKDMSKLLTNLDEHPVTRISISKGFLFACIQAANEFEEQRARFFNENELRDDYMEVREGLDIAGMPFLESIIVYSSPNCKCPWYLSAVAFWLFSIVLLSWPLRLFGDFRTAHVSYHVTKLFGTNYLSPSSMNYTGPLSRTYTMDSRDLSLMVHRDGYLIVPSYSEAMLMQTSLAPDQPTLAVGHFRSQNCSIRVSNENTVFANYGAIGGQAQTLIDQRDRHRSSRRRNLIRHFPIRSRSMSALLNKLVGRPEMPVVPAAMVSMPLARTTGAPMRSMSVGGCLTNAWRTSSYETISEEETPSVCDRNPLLRSPRHFDEPPPPYEVALKMCAPIYERLRRSANSITSRLNSLSHSNSKEFPYKRQQQQRSVDGQSSSRE